MSTFVGDFVKGVVVMKEAKISPSVVRRLPIYLRHVQDLQEAGIDTVSSKEMGAKLDLNPAQIRKDLAYFGEFGRKGVGYEVEYLSRKLEQILHLDRQIHVALVGAGHLGIALSNYTRFQNECISISGLYDRAPDKIGTQVGQLTVLPIEQLESDAKTTTFTMGIIAVPAFAAQEVCDVMVRCGIHVILNFAPVSLKVPAYVHVRSTDMTTELQSLAYYIPE